MKLHDRPCPVVPQHAVVHGVRHRETPADQGPARGGHLPAEPGQQGAAVAQLGPVHHVRGGRVRVLDGRGRVHGRAAVVARRLVRRGRLLVAAAPRPQRRPVRDRGLRTANQARVPVQPPGKRQRLGHRFRGVPRPAAAATAVHAAVRVAVVRRQIAVAAFPTLNDRRPLGLAPTHEAEFAAVAPNIYRGCLKTDLRRERY